MHTNTNSITCRHCGMFTTVAPADIRYKNEIFLPVGCATLAEYHARAECVVEQGYEGGYHP